MVPDVGMNLVGEIYWSGAARQGDHLALRSEHVDLLKKQIHFERVEKILRVLYFRLSFQQTPDPAQMIFLIFGFFHAILVLPVRRNALLRDLVHFPAAYLHLHPLTAGTVHRGVQGLVHVGLGHGDVVLESSRNGTPQRMHQTQRGVTILDRIGDHPDADEIVDILQVNLLEHHFFVDAVIMFGPSAHHSLDLHRGQLLFHCLANSFNQNDALILALVHAVLNGLVFFRLNVLEGPVFQLRLQPANAQAVGDGGIDIQGFSGNATLLLGRHGPEGPQIMSPVCELDHNHANVMRHSQNHLAIVLRLLFFLAGELDLADLGHPFDHVINFFTEHLFDFFFGGQGVFQRVVQESRRHGLLIHLQTRQVVRHLHRMRKIGLSRLSALATMRFRGKEVGIQDDVYIRFRVIR